jgi:hypothetical protein
MNEFTTNPKAEVGNKTPLSELETITIPQLSGNDQVETGHELSTEVDTMIKEVQELAETNTESTTENNIEVPQVELAEELKATEATLPPEEIKKKGTSKLQQMLFGAASAVLVAGTGLFGANMLGKKSEGPKMQEGPKMEQVNTNMFDSPNKVVDNSNSANIVSPSTPGEQPTTPLKTESAGAPKEQNINNEVEIQNLMKEGRSREDSIMTLKNRAKYGAQGEMNDGEAMKESESKESQRLAEIKAQAEARAQERSNRSNFLKNSGETVARQQTNKEPSLGDGFGSVSSYNAGAVERSIRNPHVNNTERPETRKESANTNKEPSLGDGFGSVTLYDAGAVERAAQK